MWRSIVLLTCSAFSIVSPIEAAAQDYRVNGDHFSILATSGGYYLRTVSPKGDQLTASCQLLSRGKWTYGLRVHGVVNDGYRYTPAPQLTISKTWSYPLTPENMRNDFSWNAPGKAAFISLLSHFSSMGWNDRFVSDAIGLSFSSHGGDDPGTIAAFKHLCHLPDSGSSY